MSTQPAQARREHERLAPRVTSALTARFPRVRRKLWRRDVESLSQDH